LKKQHLLLSLGLVSAITLAACGDTDNTEDPANDTEGSTTETNTEATDDENDNTEEENTTDEDTEANDGDWETAVGETIENDGGSFTLVAREDNIDTVETGPMTLDIPQLNVQDVNLSGDLLDFIEFEPTGIIQIDMEVSNTSDDDINFYPDQATITTNTGEQLEADLWFSDHIGGEYLGAVNKSGSVYYLLENSNPEDIDTIRITMSAPHTLEDWEDVGEAVDFEVSIN